MLIQLDWVCICVDYADGRNVVIGSTLPSFCLFVFLYLQINLFYSLQHKVGILPCFPCKSLSQFIMKTVFGVGNAAVDALPSGAGHIVALKSSSQSAANDQPVGCKWFPLHLQDGTGHIGGFKKLKLCESRGGRPGLLSLIRLCFVWT